MRKIIISFLFITFFAFNLNAASHYKAGSTSCQILELSPGVRPSGMGGAYVAVSDDMSAIYSNPAGLAWLNTIQISGGSHQLFQGIKHYYSGITYPLDDIYAANIKDLGTIGASYSQLDMGRIQGMDSGGNETYIFIPRDQLFTISYAKTFGERLSIGCNTNYVLQRVAGYKLNVFAFDIGTLWQTPVDGLNIGLVAKNIGGKTGFARNRHELPLTFKVGVAYRVPGDALILATDFDKPIFGYSSIKIGTEYWIKRILAIRLGYDSQHDLGNGITYGIGIKVEKLDFFFMPVEELDIDYAYISSGNLGDNHRFSLTLKFSI